MPDHAGPGKHPRQKARGQSVAQSFCWGFCRQEWARQENLGLGGLNDFAGPWAIQVVSSYLVPGPDLGQGEYWLEVWEFAKKDSREYAHQTGRFVGQSFTIRGITHCL